MVDNTGALVCIRSLHMTNSKPFCWSDMLFSRKKVFAIIASVCVGILCFFLLIVQYFQHFGHNELINLSNYRTVYLLLIGVVSSLSFVVSKFFIYRIQDSRSMWHRVLDCICFGVVLVFAIFLTNTIMIFHRGRLIESVNVQGVIEASRLDSYLNRKLSFPVVVVQKWSEIEVIFERGPGRRDVVMEKIRNTENGVILQGQPESGGNP